MAWVKIKYKEASTIGRYPSVAGDELTQWTNSGASVCYDLIYLNFKETKMEPNVNIRISSHNGSLFILCSSLQFAIP